MTYSDYVFWDHSRGNVLETESLPARQVEEFAQKLARRHRCRVAYAEVKDYFIEPDLCPNCQEIMPESGSCWCSTFEEEEPVLFEGPGGKLLVPASWTEEGKDAKQEVFKAD